MKIDQDHKERFRVFMLFCLEAYKVLMGTFLCITVPHSCEDNEDCSMMDTIRTATGYTLLTFIVNGITCFAICTLYTVELCRENFFIKTFDIDPNFSDLNLKSVISPALERKLLAWNEIYWKAAASSTALVTTNIALSSVYLARNYRGASTVTSTLSFSLLVLMKLWRSFSMARKDHHSVRARSAYMTEYSSFNVIDEDVPAHLRLPEQQQEEVSSTTIELTLATKEED